ILSLRQAGHLISRVIRISLFYQNPTCFFSAYFLKHHHIFIDKFNEIYFLDLGRAGLADEFVDISFVERCLREDASEETAKIFLKHLKNDRPDKRNYFLKLDELN
ncbi:hypothetical protein ACWB3V_20160, partial [Acinetobacter baumannii]